MGSEQDCQSVWSWSALNCVGSDSDKGSDFSQIIPYERNQIRLNQLLCAHSACSGIWIIHSQYTCILRVLRSFLSQKKQSKGLSKCNYGVDWLCGMLLLSLGSHLLYLMDFQSQISTRERDF